MSYLNVFVCVLVLIPSLARAQYPSPTFQNLTVRGTLSVVGGVTADLSSPGPVGSVVPNTGAFTSLSASGAVSGAGFTARLASPGPIGNVATSTGAFTSLSASSTVSGAGFTSWAASPQPIGSTAPNTGAFTSLSASGAVSGAGFTPLVGVNVKQFGAAMDGTTDDNSAFNSARIAAGNNGTVFVPAGGFNITVAPTGGSTSPILWKLSGNAAGTGTSPIIGLGTDTIETTLTGAKFFSRTNTVADAAPVVRIDNTMTNTGGTGAYVVPTLQVNTATSNVSSNDYAWGVVSTLHSQSTGASQNVAIAGFAYKDANGSAVWGTNIIAADTTGNNSLTSGALIGNEQGLSANGTDTGGGALGSIPSGLGIRVSQDLVFSKYSGGGSAAVFGWGVRVSGPASGVSIDFPYSVVNLTVNKAAFDTEYATLAAGADAFRMASGQSIGFDGTGLHTLFYNSGNSSLESDSGAFLLNNGTSNNLVFGTGGIGLPTFTTRSVGTKIVLYPSLTGAATDFGIGIAGGTFWMSIDGAANSFAWFGGTTQVASLSGAGVLNVTGSYQVAGTKVIGARDTGWTAMTGTPDKATAYATSTVTLAQLAGRVAQLQASLTTHGLIGP